MLLTEPITKIPLIGRFKARLLNNLGIFANSDLLYHIPVLYKDSTKLVPLRDLKSELKQTTIGKVINIRNIRLRGGKTMQKALVSDDTAEVEVIWFNQPYLVKSFEAYPEVMLSGKLNPKLLTPQLVSPEFEIIREQGGESVHLGRIVPVYALTKGVTAKWLRSRLKWLITHLKQLPDLTDSLPTEIKQQFSLLSLGKALELIHFPNNKNDLIAARKRLAFDELIAIQTKLLVQKHQRIYAQGPNIKLNQEEITAFIEQLPFKLTSSQVQAYQEIHHDLIKNYPMRRLLQGDVGSGKTVVAALGAMPVMSSGFQAVLLAPTSVLVKQHYQTLLSWIPKEYRIGLITSETSKEIENLSKLDLIIGTHAVLYHKDKLISNLGLVIIDEQHRFGVEQRRELLNLKNSKFVPHLLHITATPIPRSIALTLFGDLDVSGLVKPPGRVTTETFLVPEQKRSESYNWVEKKIIEGNQVFWVFPLIEEGLQYYSHQAQQAGAEPTESKTTKAVTKAYLQLKKIFKGYKIGMMHGRFSGKHKDKVIKDFREKKLDILLATTVIEVGIDIPQASVIIIESAERYGLAQLHQLRGRVGRNNQRSWCLLFTEKEQDPLATSRLQFFCKESSGIKIAEYDLQVRGPGEVYGTVQAGIPELKVARFSNSALLEESRLAALKLLNLTQLKT